MSGSEWKLVPVKLTTEMHCAACNAALNNHTDQWPQAVHEAMLAAAPQPAQEPVATLHDDGCFTWKNDKFRLQFDRQRVGWRMDVYASPQPQPAPLTDAALAASQKDVGQPPLAFPPGYCLDPNGVMCQPADSGPHYDFGYEVGFRDAMAIKMRAVAAQPQSGALAPLLKRLRAIAEGISVYGAPDKDLLAQRIELLLDELNRHVQLRQLYAEDLEKEVGRLAALNRGIGGKA